MFESDANSADCGGGGTVGGGAGSTPTTTTTDTQLTTTGVGVDEAPVEPIAVGQAVVDPVYVPAPMTTLERRPRPTGKRHGRPPSRVKRGLDAKGWEDTLKW